MIVLGFLGVILLGALLLLLPCSSANHTWMKPADAIFTACSAVCITGLTVIDIGTDLSRFGHCVLLFLVQLGCAGIMTIATFFLSIAGTRISYAGEFQIKNDFGTRSVNGWRDLVKWVVISMVVITLLGMVALHYCFPGQSWFNSYFYSVMAFCNAGFSLDSSSLGNFHDCPLGLGLLTMGFLVVLGGLGFVVIFNIFTIQFWRRNLIKRGKIKLHSKVVLSYTIFLLLLMFAVVLALEWNRALANYPISEKFSIAAFEAVSPRTCGFTVVPLETCHPATRFIMELMMFVGAGPGGAGGGIKVTTFAVFAVMLVTICRRRRDVTLFKATLPNNVVRESIVIVMVFSVLVSLAMTVLLISDGNTASFENLFFETISAVSTTGLSIGDTTSSLSQVGRCVLMLSMLCGRLGALAVVMLIGGDDVAPVSVKYPVDGLMVG